MVDRKDVPFDEFYYQLKLTHVFQKHPVYHETIEFPVLQLSPLYPTFDFILFLPFLNQQFNYLLLFFSFFFCHPIDKYFIFTILAFTIASLSLLFYIIKFPSIILFFNHLLPFIPFYYLSFPNPFLLFVISFILSHSLINISLLPSLFHALQT
jgi:hypothetical protein